MPNKKRHFTRIISPTSSSTSSQEYDASSTTPRRAKSLSQECLNTLFPPPKRRKRRNCGNKVTPGNTNGQTQTSTSSARDVNPTVQTHSDPCVPTVVSDAVHDGHYIGDNSITHPVEKNSVTINASSPIVECDIPSNSVNQVLHRTTEEAEVTLPKIARVEIQLDQSDYLDLINVTNYPKLFW